MAETEVKEKAKETISELIDAALEGKLSGKFDGLVKMSDVDAKLEKMTKNLVAKEPEKKETEKAEMSEGVLANIAKTEFFGIEFGKIAVGTAGGVFGSELIDGFLATQQDTIKGIVKLVVAGTVGTWGKKWIGKDAAMAIALSWVCSACLRYCRLTNMHRNSPCRSGGYSLAR